MKVFKTIFALFFFLVVFSEPILASDEFDIGYRVTFEAKNDSSVHIEQQITMTNKFSNIYATSYSLSIDKTSPVNIKAFDSSGNLNLTTKKEGDTTSIIVNFNNPSVGKGKTTTFTISYDSFELVKKSGQIWEVMVPRVINIDKMLDYELNLMVPLNFGKAAYISPKTSKTNSDGRYQTYTYRKEQLLNSGVVAAFGEFQLFDFNFMYHLSNPLNELVITKIAIPPDTELQKVSYKSIEPPPVNIEIDQDGNWLAIYYLQPRIKTDVAINGQVKLFSSPVPFGFISNKNPDDYLAPQKYWESDDPQIVELAKNINTPEKIYNFVVGKLDYDYSRVKEGAERFGAKGALENPNRAMCMEFSDLFVALCRSAGIPARVINGYSYTDNSTLKPLSLVQDILHAWPEYWDEERKIWIQVDPTWQNTTGGVDYFNKLDLGHFAFAIHGLDSQYPIPAGGYKEIGVTQKDINVTFGEYQSIIKGDIEVSFDIPSSIFSEKSNSGKIILKNIGNEALYNLSFNLTTNGLKVTTKSDKDINQIPPFGTVEIPVEISADNGHFLGEGKISVNVNGKSYQTQLKISSLIVNFTFPAIILLILLIFILWIIRKIFTRLKFRRKIV